MLGPGVSRSSTFVPVPAPRLRLLLISDSPEQKSRLCSGINCAEYEITEAQTLEEVGIACLDLCDVVVLDVGPSQILPMLKIIRMSKGHSKIPILVESTRINNDFNLAGVLPSYRAMPCSRPELFTLLRRYDRTTSQAQQRRGML